MGWEDFVLGGTGSGSSSGAVGNINYQQVSPTSDPTFARLLADIEAMTPKSLPGIDSIVSGGMNSPLLQLVMGPALQRLQGPQAQARQGLTEQARAAGSLRSSQYGKDMNTLRNNQALQQNDLMGQIIQQVLGTLVSGSLQSQQNSLLPGKSYTDLLRTVAPQTLTGANTAVSGGYRGGSGASSISPSAEELNAEALQRWAAVQRGLNVGPGSAEVGVNSPKPGGATTAPISPYTPYLDPFGGGGSGVTFNPSSGRYESAPSDNLGFFTAAQGGPNYPAPAPAWDVSGAYNPGGVDNTESPWWMG